MSKNTPAVALADLDAQALSTHGTVGAALPSALLPPVDRWAVAWTKPRCEHCVEEYFKRLHVSCFLPLISRRQIYKSGVKHWTSPLFSGYIFYDQDQLERHRIFESRKVVDILIPPDPGALGRELFQIALALEHDSALREARFGQKGRPVSVTRGPMKGLQGGLVRSEER